MTSSAQDKCTLYSDRNLKNRRNVVSDVTKGYAPDKQMFLLALKSRIVTAVMIELGMERVDGKPTKNEFQRTKLFSNHNLPSKQQYVKRLAALIIDTYVMNSSDAKDMVKEVMNEKDQLAFLAIQTLPNGRFPCRFEGCNKSFKYVILNHCVI